MVATGMRDNFENGIKVGIDQNSLNFCSQINEIMRKNLGTVQDEMLQMRKLRRDISEAYEQLLAQQKTNLMANSVNGALQYMAKQLTELVQEVHQIKEEGIKKQIRLDLTMDGYEMVKRKPPSISPPEDEQDFDPEHSIKELLNTLNEREALVLTYRLGLLGQEKSTFAAIGKIIKLTAERVRLIHNKALMKCRHPSRRKLATEITHEELRKAILGD